MDKKTYIFDFDGTLVDSMPKATQAILGFLDERGVDYPDDIIKTVIPLGYIGLSHYFSEHFHMKETPEEVYAELMRRMTGLYAKEIMPKLYVEETLGLLKAQGASLSIFTASPHVFLDPCIERLGWAKYFDNLWTVEDFPVSKADPKAFRIAAERLGCAYGDCVMVDDSVNALRPAKQAGLFAIGIFDEFSAEYEAEMRSIGDDYIYDFSEMLKF